jgi:ATP-binding cassette, subfamily B, heavy metal transporter
MYNTRHRLSSNSRHERSLYPRAKSGHRLSPHFVQTNDETSNLLYQHERKKPTLLSFVAPYVIPAKPQLKLIAVVSVTSTILYKLSLLLPAVGFKMVVDVITDTRLDTNQKSSRAMWSVSLYFVGRLGAAVFSSIQEVTFEHLSHDISRRFGVALYSHLQFLDLRFHNRSSSGKSSQILSSGISALTVILRIVVLQLVPTLVEAVVVSTVFASLHSPVCQCVFHAMPPI